MVEAVGCYACSEDKQKSLGFSYPVFSPALNPINFWWLQKFVLETEGLSPSFQKTWVFHPMLLLTSVTLGKLPHLFVPVSPPFPCPNENTSPLGWSHLLLCVCVVVIEWQQPWYIIHQSPSSLKSKGGDMFSHGRDLQTLSDLTCILFAKCVYVVVLNKRGAWV